MKKYFYGGDIHGEAEAWVIALEEAGFDWENDNHIFLNLGDSFDRGPQNVEVLERLLWLKDEGRLISIQGNHDDFIWDFLKGDRALVTLNARSNGFDETLNQWSSSNYKIEDIARLFDTLKEKINKRYPSLKQYMKSMVDEVVIDNYSFTHAGRSYDPYFHTWSVNSWAKTPVFVETYPNTEKKIHVFGHWAGYKLHNKFNLTEEERLDVTKHANPGRKFVSKDGCFIGMDAWSNLSNKVNIGVLVSESEPILIRHPR